MRSFPHLAAMGVLLLYAGLNSILYACLLPLWEGFDEPFHYSYVQQLSAGRGFPVLGRSLLTSEVAESLLLAPGSLAVQHNFPQITTFQQYAALPGEERQWRRTRLEALSREGHRSATGTPLNYEAHQAPLAYLLLAGADAPLSGRLLTRVLVLRLFCAVAGTGLTFAGVWVLARQLGLTDRLRFAAAFCLFSSQMYFAATSHIANDWLAIALTTWLFVAGARLLQYPGLSAAVGLAGVLALGLLTKAYFLAFVPLVLGTLVVLVGQRRLRVRDACLSVALLLALAGPWYGRNVRQYSNLSGMQESSSGHLGLFKILRTFVHVPWWTSLTRALHSSLWTGNNSFTSFSLRTLDVMLLLLAAGVAAYGWQSGWLRIPAAGRFVVAGMVLFGFALMYATASSYAFTGGAALAVSPWYVQAIWPALLCLVFAGFSKFRWLVVTNVWLWFYVITVTYVAKLIPLYGGRENANAHAWELVQWFANRQGLRHELLRDWCLVAPGILDGLLTAVLLLGGGLAAWISLYAMSGDPSPDL